MPTVQWPVREREQKITTTSAEFKRAIREIKPWVVVRMLLASYQWYNPTRRLTWKISRLRSTRDKQRVCHRNHLRRTLKPKDILSNRLLCTGLCPSVAPQYRRDRVWFTLITTASDYEKKERGKIGYGWQNTSVRICCDSTTVQRCEAPKK